MIFLASQWDLAMPLYMFGAFCFLIAIVCVTKGRVRQFVGSLIGSAVFAFTIWYVVNQVESGVFWSGSLNESSVLTAIGSVIGLGIPGVAYAYKVRFGFRKQH